MSLIRWGIGGLLGGLAGVVIWALVGYLTEREVGWIAWGIGFLVGVGVRYSAYLNNEEEGVVQGVIAAIIAVGSIIAGKYALFIILIVIPDANAVRILEELRSSDETMIAQIANEIAEKKVKSGDRVEWAEGVTGETAFKKEHYPQDVWDAAQDEWNLLSAEERSDRRDSLIGMVEGLTLDSKPVFFDFFSAFDLLWFGLAAITAFRIGYGTYGDD